jgi:hypothetical protein
MILVRTDYPYLRVGRHRASCLGPPREAKEVGKEVREATVGHDGRESRQGGCD